MDYGSYLNFLFSIRENHALYSGSIENTHTGDARENPNIVLRAPAPYVSNTPFSDFEIYPLWLAGLTRRLPVLLPSQSLKGVLLKTYTYQVHLLRRI